MNSGNTWVSTDNPWGWFYESVPRIVKIIRILEGSSKGLILKGIDLSNVNVTYHTVSEFN